MTDGGEEAALEDHGHGLLEHEEQKQAGAIEENEIMGLEGCAKDEGRTVAHEVAAEEDDGQIRGDRRIHHGGRRERGQPGHPALQVGRRVERGQGRAEGCQGVVHWRRRVHGRVFQGIIWPGRVFGREDRKKGGRKKGKGKREKRACGWPAETELSWSGRKEGGREGEKGGERRV